MTRELWQAVGHGKQGRAKTRSQETQEESSAEGESACDLCGEQANHRETLVGGYGSTASQREPMAATARGVW
jgi:hypothetical protein